MVQGKPPPERQSKAPYSRPYEWITLVLCTKQDTVHRAFLPSYRLGVLVLPSFSHFKVWYSILINTITSVQTFPKNYLPHSNCFIFLVSLYIFFITVMFAHGHPTRPWVLSERLRDSSCQSLSPAQHLAQSIYWMWPGRCINFLIAGVQWGDGSHPHLLVLWLDERVIRESWKWQVTNSSVCAHSLTMK